MKKFNYKDRISGYIDRLADYMKMGFSKSMSVDSLAHMSAEELQLIQDGIKLMEDGRNLLNDVCSQFDEMQDELIQAKEDREKMMQMLEELTRKNK